jgi:hypothetical protein
MSSAQNRRSGRRGAADSGMDDPRTAGAHSVGYQEESEQSGTQGRGATGQYPSEQVDYGRGGTGQYPSESAQYGRGESRGAGTRAYPEERAGRGGAEYPGRHVGGAALTTLTGLLTAFVGIVGIIKGVFFASVGTYPFYYSVRSRGITELVIGAVLIMLGVCLLLGMHWARGAAIAVLAIAAIAAFLFIPFYPFWSILLLALSVFSIWEIARSHHPREFA